MKYISSEKLLQEYFNDERHQINLIHVANFKAINEELRRCCNTKKESQGELQYVLLPKMIIYFKKVWKHIWLWKLDLIFVFKSYNLQQEMNRLQNQIPRVKWEIHKKLLWCYISEYVTIANENSASEIKNT